MDETNKGKDKKSGLAVLNVHSSEEAVVFIAKDRAGVNQEVLAPKEIMLFASPVLRTMLKEEWNSGGKLLINNFTSETLWLLVEFLYNLKLHTTTVTCQDLVELAIVADYFMIRVLGTYCYNELSAKVSVQDVWWILDHVLPIEPLEHMAQTCEKVLQNKTQRCLENMAFYSAKKESIMYLLQQKSLHIGGETDLLMACWQWANKHENPLAALKDLLPHLKIKEGIKGRMERLIGLGVSKEDFVDQFQISKNADDWLRLCETNLRKYTLFKEYVDPPKDIMFKALVANFKVRECDEKSECILKINPHQEFHLEIIYIPSFYTLEPKWLPSSDNRLESVPELLECEYNVNITDTLGRDITYKGSKSFQILNKMSQMRNVIALPRPLRIFPTVQTTIKVTLNGNKRCVWRTCDPSDSNLEGLATTKVTGHNIMSGLRIRK